MLTHPAKVWGQVSYSTHVLLHCTSSCVSKAAQDSLCSYPPTPTPTEHSCGCCRQITDHWTRKKLCLCPCHLQQTWWARSVSSTQKLLGLHPSVHITDLNDRAWMFGGKFWIWNWLYHSACTSFHYFHWSKHVVLQTKYFTDNQCLLFSLDCEWNSWLVCYQFFFYIYITLTGLSWVYLNADKSLAVFSKRWLH